MENTGLFIMEMIGTVAFSVSGAMLAIQKRLDVLGITVLGVVTACGGGMIRDLILGRTPPNMFIHPVYVEVAIISALLMFAAMKSNQISILFDAKAYDWIMNVLDAIGLGAFTVVGVDVALGAGFLSHPFFCIFLGVLTGVGGGFLRDIMAMEVPAILYKNIYACASLAGAISYILSKDSILPYPFRLGECALIVVMIRIFSKEFDWNLPKAN